MANEYILIPKHFPRYVRLGVSSTRLRLCGYDPTSKMAVYYRDAGEWSLNAVLLTDRVVAAITQVHWQLKHIDGVELVPSTRKAWAKDNWGYVKDNTRAAERVKIIEEVESDGIPF